MSSQNPNLRPLTISHNSQLIRGHEFRPATAGERTPAVLIVHGFGDSSVGPQRLFVQTARYLARSGALVRAYDRLGHGLSDGEFEEITIRDEIEQISSMIREFSADHSAPIHLVAHSLGAVESAIAAANLPELIASITLWSPAGVVVDDITVKNEIQGQSLAAVKRNHGFDFGGMWLGQPFIDDIRNDLDVYQAASRYGGPAHILHGTADQIVPLEYGRRYTEYLPQATFTPVPSADHTWSSRTLRNKLLTQLISTLNLQRNTEPA